MSKIMQDYILPNDLLSDDPAYQEWSDEYDEVTQEMKEQDDGIYQDEPAF